MTGEDIKKELWARTQQPITDDWASYSRSGERSATPCIQLSLTVGGQLWIGILKAQGEKGTRSNSWRRTLDIELRKTKMFCGEANARAMDRTKKRTGVTFRYI